ncbi:MAG: bacterial transcriptional activator domain-containing protein [Micrococcales bacterium]|nr:bacterial transcriptional activator domain-containing protein [Micrococcales bacterium]
MNVVKGPEETDEVIVSLVGDLGVSIRGEPLAVPMMAARLIGFLAVHARPLRRSYVSGSLWPEVDERHAAASLRTALWRVPSRHGTVLVCATNSHLGLGSNVRVDLHEISRLAAALDGHGDPPLRWADVAHALPGLSDDLLTGWYDDWAAAERERFHQARLHLFDRIGEHLLLERRYGHAFEVGLALVRAEPLHESGHRIIVRVHLEEGNIADAFRCWELYAARLAREVGATPSPAMAELLQPYRVRRGRRVASAPAAHGGWASPQRTV